MLRGSPGAQYGRQIFSGPPSIDDVVVVVPGIQGTQLLKDGKPVWALSGKALWTGLLSLGNSVRDLALPADIGDESPGDGVELGGLMPDLHGVPGLGPFIGGYSDLGAWVRKNLGLRPGTAGEAGNLVEFGYDWRLSNRHTSALLKVAAEEALHRWRSEGHPDAKLVFFCHSMGGLIARHYLEVGGGAEHTRALVTVGTPHRGSLKALDNLVNGRVLKLGPLHFNVGDLARTFPSAYQLLPAYSCIDTGVGREDLLAATPPNLEASRVADALAFHREIETAAAAGGEPPYVFRMIVGTRQPTLATARITATGVEPLLTIDGDDDLGDGTVSRFASIPSGVQPNDPRQVSSSKRHGWLQQSEGVLDDLYGILTARRRAYMSDVPDIDQAPGIELPEVVGAGAPIALTARSADATLLLRATLLDAEGVAVDSQVLGNLEGGDYAGELKPPGPGAYEVVLAGPPSARFDSVADAVLVEAY